ncbi:MAG: hypothetical protein IKT16_05550, partial [Desulfovibrio sp.]|nr:hypothetical protein [Desulfovibrio sp.]
MAQAASSWGEQGPAAQAEEFMAMPALKAVCKARTLSISGRSSSSGTASTGTGKAPSWSLANLPASTSS